MRKRIAAVVIGVLLLLSRFNLNVYADDKDLDQFLHRSNVVFVTDESGSMKQTDPNNNRYEAIRLFLGEMANEGNYVGSVSFGEQLVDSSNIEAINGQVAKDALLADISDQQYSNYTNIGRGLIEAVNMLDSGRNKDLDSAIILLTDGNTDMPDEEQYNESIAMKADAIDRARKAGYKIFTICLNVNGAADSKEMRQIAEATGGEFAEVTSAEDLNDIETMFNKLIFNSFEDMDFANLELVIGSDGTVSTDFDIPGVGVEEINVLFQGSLADCELVDPSGKHYKGGTDGAVLVNGADFLLIKVQEPVGGRWQAVAFGDPDTVISLRLLYNSNFYVVASMDAPSEVHLGDTVKVIAQIGTSAGIVSDTSRYTDMTATATVKYGDQVKENPMRIGQNGFEYEMNVSEEGTYYISVKAANNDMEAAADEEFEISVNNTAPVASEKELSAHANIWPVIGGTASLDLKDAATDPEGQAVTYTIESSAFNEEDYTLDGTKLTVNKFSIPKGSFTVKGADPYGAYCTFDVRFTSTNIGIIMAIVALVGILIAIVAVIVVIRIAMGKALIGTLAVSNFDKSRRYPPQIKDHGRGQIPLAQFSLDLSSLPEGCKFQCDGGNAQIWFISKKPVYTDYAVGPTKKFRIRGDGMEVRICGDDKMEKGIMVVFKSDKLNALGY
ncbi:vWA domain-containing protein [Butyrivibrio sp. VCB2001]|uniref:vWA domain-containing protein n=1 Tax=Butyrivibrio sp. VCB2001 TaxID=1280667 RepID=UPI0004009699|nr:vWA domain-containing protein [Butyrivibrio sp. VCB2001]